MRIVHQEERNNLNLGNVRYELLTPPVVDDEEYAVEALELIIEPGGEKGSEQFGHPGREMGILLEGRAELLYGTETFILKQGDSVSFSSSVPHTLVNTGKKALKAIWIITPPPDVFSRMTKGKDR